MKRTSLEIVVGAFLLAGFISFSWLAVKMGDINPFQSETYPMTARFTSISGLKEGSTIELAGVVVGKVSQIELDAGDYEAVVHLNIDKTIELTDDSIASIRTSGIIGDKFIKLTPGGSDIMLEAGDEIDETESAISLEELVSKYIFESE
ncbi:MAG: outer membrane lipid asymmetry maintenance protein MlaD [Gammaproteobacteria bacterium]|jgi:phospholipid/cholesterol/gamma-HCH transport system substrate-binding protein|nr:outer membrane lipid asymmetry maintenance protein MlaD [Gammaproteobacteria bacterium]MDH3887036.1 outer membrane lipid asymmetry maintenance protein MlaD [Gammaproteobacteria bacterium]MDH3933657.1 outer membrane lipid asymmetry maintenance protein MlaD [Gammaproteobacteria bacterium]MDH3970840.1 outer membrane lipid asymmetry maintenance protein MlaD [Gammaproteobacteria bacterium]MDH3986189.1 outer membrane lipid asymmetry maintenance protein MlaD [Gammaproteobacteria bacterium]